MKGHAVRAYKFARNKADGQCGKLGAGITTCHIIYIAGGQAGSGQREQGGVLACPAGPSMCPAQRVVAELPAAAAAAAPRNRPQPPLHGFRERGPRQLEIGGAPVTVGTLAWGVG